MWIEDNTRGYMRWRDDRDIADVCLSAEPTKLDSSLERIQNLEREIFELRCIVEELMDKKKPSNIEGLI